MPVNLLAPDPRAVAPVLGVDLGTACAGIRKPDRRDLLVVRFAPGSVAAATFTRNRFCAAPVTVARNHLAACGQRPQALVVNTGNANAGTGSAGLANASRVCAAAAALLKVPAESVLPMSTGVILEHLPVARIEAGLPAAVADLAPSNWLAAAEAIMTTDTVPKAVSRQLDIDGTRITITGIAKGSGMIRPNMATMLALIVTDAAIAAPPLQALVRQVADASFNRISVDGDTSTNDTLLVVATGRSGASIDAASTGAVAAFSEALTAVAIELAQALIRDGEGATKFITVCIEGARTLAEASAVAYAIAHSPLVKTAFFACDPNLGRILAAVGYAGIDDLDVQSVDVYLDDVHVASGGMRHPNYQEADGQRVMNQAEITVRVGLGRGDATTTVWTCDLSHAYVSINADYRS